MERTCGTLILINTTVKTLDGELVQCPAQPQVIFCERNCHAALRASTGSGLSTTETQNVAVIASEGVIAREAIDPNTVLSVAVSMDEHQINLCEQDVCAEDN
jgi:hypothetical protein